MGQSNQSPDNRAAAAAAASAPASPVEGPSSSSRSSFFSRFSLLRSRARNIADFHIRPAEPHRNYGAGDHVKGAVILTIVKPVRITHLVVSLHGYMRVYKGPNVPANEPIVDPAEVPAIPILSSRQKSHPSGYVKLFQDEQALSADGRLEPGRYEFNFDLLFPTHGLPSSIDFERGTISYVITATLTRPTSMGTKVPPKTSCERKISLIEKVDVGPLAPPRPRTIYLEPVSKRPKKKKQPGVSAEKVLAAPDTAEPASDMDSTRANENSTEGSLSVIGEDRHEEAAGSNSRNLAQCDVRSVSSDSAVSRSTDRSKCGDNSHPVTSPTAVSGGKAISAVKERTITATVELQKGGCLPGDTVPIKISVQHIKRIKSLHGVIVTLYRLGRIDSSPWLPSKELPSSNDRKGGKEEYYPKSKTGLGGLSLSAAGSCSVFRKDLSQSLAPLIIDPATLTATLTTSVRVPEDVFPTIKGVPYEMITFKYHVEVIVDLGGKLANQIQAGKSSVARVNTVSGPLGLTGTAFDGAASLTSWGTSIIDTDRLRRQKGVISVMFEVVVGTTDSNRLRGKAPLKPTPSVHTVPVRERDLYDGDRGEKQPWPAPAENDPYAPADYPHDYGPSPASQPTYSALWNSPSPPPPSAPVPYYIPPPEVPDESTLTEKERIRRAEQRLLPSQPPEIPTPVVAGPSGAHHPPAADVPIADENIYDAEDDAAQPPPPPPPPLLLPPDAADTPSAPTLEDLSQGTAHYHHPTEDKQELERQRLLAEASAPPEFPEDCDPGPSSAAPLAVRVPSAAAAAEEFEPSAPVLSEEEGGGEGDRSAAAAERVYAAEDYTYTYSYGPHLASASDEAEAGGGGVGVEAGSEPLPRYER